MPWGALAGSGWASGLNVYATVFLMGLAGRLGWAETPTRLQTNTVLAIAGAAWAVEFFADKIPYVDNAWDSVHTFIRPIGAMWLATVIGGNTNLTSGIPAALTAGGLALTSHGAKATTRAAVNVSPEPFSNIALSLFEDGLVGAMVALSLAYPKTAAVVAACLAVLCVLIVVKLARFIRRVFRWFNRQDATQ